MIAALLTMAVLSAPPPPYSEVRRDRPPVLGLTPAGMIFQMLTDNDWLAAAPDSFCDVADGAGILTGHFACVNGDGTTTYGGDLTLSQVGTLEDRSLPVCKNGQDCDAMDAQRTGLYGQNATGYWTTGSTTHGNDTDFTVCAMIRSEGHDVGAGVARWGADWAAQESWGLMAAGSVWAMAGVTAGSLSGPQYSGVSVVAGGTQLLCAVYDYVGTGNVNTIRWYSDGTLVRTVTSVNDFRDTSNAITLGTYWTGSSHYSGGTNLFGALYSERISSDAEMLELGTAMAPRLTGTRGETLTYTRTGTMFCENSAVNAGSFVPLNVPCVNGDGYYNRQGVTNSLLYSQAFDNAVFTKVNATVTANTGDDPAGTKTADTVTSTAAGGYIEQSVGTTLQYYGSASVFVRTTSGTQAGELFVYNATDSTEGCGYVSQNHQFTATTTWQRVGCVQPGSNGKEFRWRLYPGGRTGTGTIEVAFGQFEDDLGVWIGPYVPTISAAASMGVGSLRLEDATAFAAFSHASYSMSLTYKAGHAYGWYRYFAQLINSGAGSCRFLFLGTHATAMRSLRSLPTSCGTQESIIGSVSPSWVKDQTYALRWVVGTNSVSWYRGGTLMETLQHSASYTLPLSIKPTALYIGVDSSTFASQGHIKNFCLGISERACP